MHLGRIPPLFTQHNGSNGKLIMAEIMYCEHMGKLTILSGRNLDKDMIGLIHKTWPASRTANLIIVNA